MQKEHKYYVYIITNYEQTIFYIGVTNNIANRMMYHGEKINEKSFSAKYHLDRLIYYEEYTNVNDAITREKQLKNWHRDWKINLVKEMNPEMRDLWENA